MRLYIHGLGGAGRGFEEPYDTVSARVEDVPIKDYASAGQRRRFGKLAKLVYVSASRALADAGVLDPQSLPIISGTALGEATVSLELLAQIHETRGVGVSPSLVPNSVHNSPAAYLSIGLANRAPSLTVSQGWLSAQAALVAAQDYLEAGLSDRALVVVGDEADPAWIERLMTCGAAELSNQLRAEALQETSMAVVVGLRPGGRRRGEMQAAVVRAKEPTVALEAMLRQWGVELRPRVEMVVLGLDCPPDLATLAARAGARLVCPGPGLGTSGAGALACFTAQRDERDTVVVLSFEQGELGVMCWTSGCSVDGEATP